MSNIYKLNWSSFSHKASQSAHDDSRETFTHASSLNQGDGGATSFINKSDKIEDQFDQPPFELDLPLQQIKYY